MHIDYMLLISTVELAENSHAVLRGRFYNGKWSALYINETNDDSASATECSEGT